ncbi:hypothetical protein GCM10010329_76990 [Streptomyces spiroverticillatus]|uniref:Uncharacterized protein n=1 Tax=Streptomyces finlayi TaxID=67296 RepID=A0A918X5I7_9ACTN|nr:hypothetical protein GCM10010329_76990 [Streptomyces spiroverticillatus]GHD13795.1 hypothetical protein GCM10010334_72400 [Streptomyces finlayi]
MADKQVLHTVSCNEITAALAPMRAGSPVPDGALGRFAHDGDTSGWSTQVRVLDQVETEAWLRERTGPRGGLRYRLCRRCAPLL